MKGSGIFDDGFRFGLVNGLCTGVVLTLLAVLLFSCRGCVFF